MRGKNKCKILKEIRQKIADENEIPYVTRECTYQGECSGTCPKCEAELRYLEQQLERRQKLGKAVTVAALAATMMVSATACPLIPEPTAPETPTETEEVLMGEVAETFEATEEVVEGMIPATEEIEELEGDVAVETPENDCEPNCTDGN